MLLLIPKTRVPAAVASMLFIVMIEAGALEIVFGIFMLNLLALFLRSVWSKRFAWASLAFYTYLVLADLLGLPMMKHYI